MFTKKETKLLKPFFSNLNKDVFILRNMPEVLKGALFSRYSRSSLLLRDLFLKQYINSDEIDSSGYFEKISKYEDIEKILNTEKAKKFYSKWLAMYGDDSIAELTGIHIAIENISVLATKAIENSRIGISPLEKSTRYVDFSDKDNKGQYKYYKDPKIMKSEHAKEYVNTLDLMFETYSKLIDPMKEYFQKKFPQPKDVSDSAYKSSIKAKVCDTIRGLLPIAAKTNMGIFANGRAVEYLLTKMYANPLTEVQDLAKSIHIEAKKYIENFVERLDCELGDIYVSYLKNTRVYTKKEASLLLKNKFEKIKGCSVKLLEYNKNAENILAANLLYPYSNLSYKKNLDIAKNMPEKKKKNLFNNYVKYRKGRWHKPDKAFENIFYTFEITSDVGTYKDLQRHRMTTMHRQFFTTKHGYEIPKDIVKAGFEDKYINAMDSADTLYKKLKKKFPYEAQYIVSHNHFLRWKLKMNLREAFHLCELRSSPQGHPNYRETAQKIYKLICKKHPLLGDLIRYVNLEDPGLERLSAEVRKEERLKKM